LGGGGIKAKHDLVRLMRQLTLKFLSFKKSLLNSNQEN